MSAHLHRRRRVVSRHLDRLVLPAKHPVDEVEVEAEEATEATKEAEASTNLKLNLADMLKEATSEKAASESTPEGGAETAMEQQSNSLTDMLRNSILRKARTQVEV